MPHVRPQLEVLEERSLPSFLAPMNLGFEATAVAVGDMNGDGRADVVATHVGDMGSSELYVALGDGRGGLSSLRVYSAGENSSYLALGDVNGDHRLDVVTTQMSWGIGSIRVFLGNGDGTLSSAYYSYKIGTAGNRPAVADLNGDGRADIVAGNTNGTVSIMLAASKGKSLFQTPQTVTVAGSTVRIGPVAVADVTGDGKLDVVALAQPDGVYTLAGNGVGGFSPARQSFGYGSTLAIGDVNGDGRADLVTEAWGEVRVQMGAGDGTFGPAISYYGTGGSALALADVNGDQSLDIVTGAGILLNDGFGMFLATDGGPWDYWTPVANGDFNGDGLADLIIGGSILLNANDWN